MGRSFWLAVVGYLVPTFVLGFAWHLVVFAEQYHQLDLYRDDVIIPLGLSSMVIQAVIFAWMYPRLFSTRRSDWLASALAFGVVFSVLAWSFTTLPVAAKYRMTSVSEFLVLETAFTLVQFVVVAPLVALAYRRGTESSARSSQEEAYAGRS